MHYYFKLQLTRLHRRFRSWQLVPWFAWLVGTVLFVGLCALVLERGADYAWLIVIVCASTVARLSREARNDWLRGLFQPADYRRLRLLENAVITAPFTLMLLLWRHWLPAFITVLAAFLLSLYVSKRSGGRSWPTPFSDRPFEQATGIRRYWYLVPLYGYLLFQALWVGNYELGAFVLAVSWLTGLQTYATPEPLEMLRAYTMTPASFLWRKFRWGALQLLWWTLPVVLPLLLFFPERWWITLILMLLAFPNFALMLMLKYYRYPSEQSVMEGIIFAVSLFIPPVLPLSIHFYYRRATDRLYAMLP